MNYANRAIRAKVVAKMAGWEKGKGQRERLTSAEHLATAAAKVSMGRVRPGIIAREFVFEVNTCEGWDGGTRMSLVEMTY